jgi:beta-N-acetylhexosaminidase
LSREPLLIGIDQEGGRVSRLPPPFTQLPPAAVWGRIYEMEKDLKVIFRVGQYLAQELLSVGINTDFAPVLDVNSNPKNPIIGDRAFSDDPKIAARAAVAFYLGMKREGVIACGKHFPGHGDTRSDSHLTLPRVAKSLRGLEKVELPPFREAIRKKIPMLMTAHVVYDALDPKNPATLSSLILRDLLRKKLRFDGVVISDDLQMKAISKKYSEAEASILALRAGVDLLLICRGGEEGEKILEETARAVLADNFLRRRVEESCRRVAFLKKRHLKMRS